MIFLYFRVQLLYFFFESSIFGSFILDFRIELLFQLLYFDLQDFILFIVDSMVGILLIDNPLWFELRELRIFFFITFSSKGGKLLNLQLFISLFRTF